MRNLTYALLASTALAGAAQAQQAPKVYGPNDPVPTAESPQMRTIEYGPNKRVRIIGNINRATVLRFRPDEEIRMYVIGDGNSANQTWEGPDKKELEESELGNVIYLYPRRPGITSINILTVGLHGTRNYAFAAIARDVPPCKEPGEALCDDPEATYGLTFLYPADDEADRVEAERKAVADAAAAKAAKAAMDQAAAEERRIMRTNAAMRARLDTAHLNGTAECRVWEWSGRANEAARRLWGDISKIPFTDNGQQITIRFEGNKPVPAFLVPTADGKDETPVQSSSPAPGTVVLPLTGNQLRWRLGDAVVYANRLRETPDRCVSTSGTVDPSVARVLRVRQPYATQRQ